MYGYFEFSHLRLNNHMIFVVRHFFHNASYNTYWLSPSRGILGDSPMELNYRIIVMQKFIVVITHEIVSVNEFLCVEGLAQGLWKI